VAATVTDRLTGERWLSAAVYATVLVFGPNWSSLPLAYYQGVTLERRYGLATQTS
jgi:hypothetical protein